MAVPAWKLAILERKKKQEAEEKAKQLQAEEAKLASLPAWKRAIIMREKQAHVPTSSAPPPSTLRAGSGPVTPLGKVSNKWQEAVERVKGPDSPILHQKSRSYAPSSSSKASSSKVSSPSPKLATKLQDVDVLVRLSPKVPKKNLVANRWKPQKEDPTPTKSKPDSAPKADDDQSLAGLPAWKKELILRKRRAQQPPEENLGGGQDEPASADSAIATPNEEKTIEKHAEPEVVNRARKEDKEVMGLRLVEQEGKTLHPPIYKEVDEWANVKEDDSKFKDLPLWKQALIKRRRDDIAKRSGLPVTSTPTLPTPSVSNSSAPTTTRATDSASLKKETTPQWKKKKLSLTENRKAPNKTKKVTPVTKSSDVQLSKPSNRLAEKKKDAKPVRKAPSVKNDGMFSYNFSKSSHRTLDTGGSSSDSTDSDLEDAVITNLDESDEGDSGIVLQHYSMSSSSPNLNKSLSDSSMSTKPALSTPGRKKKGVRAINYNYNYN